MVKWRRFSKSFRLDLFDWPIGDHPSNYFFSFALSVLGMLIVHELARSVIFLRHYFRGSTDLGHCFSIDLFPFLDSSGIVASNGSWFFFCLNTISLWQLWKMMIRLVAFILLYPVIQAIILVEIHRDAFYRPSSSQAFIRNDSLSSGASIQTCTWLCVQDRDCRTAVYFNNVRRCSLFSEFCRDGNFQPSGIKRASVICYRNDQGRIFLLSREPCC